MAALANNLLKMLRKLNQRVGLPTPAVPAVYAATNSQNTSVDAPRNSFSFPQYFLAGNLCRNRWNKYSLADFPG